MLHRVMVGRLTYNASVRGCWSALRSVTTRSLGSQNAAWIWLVKVPGVTWQAVGVAPVAAADFSTACWPVFLDGVTLTSAGFSMATTGWAGSKRLPGSLQIDDVDAITFPFVDVLFHLEVKVGAT